MKINPARPVYTPRSGRATRSGPVRQDTPTEKPPQSAEAFPCNKYDREELGLYLEEDDDEREQRKGLDKRKAENQEDKDSRTSARVTC
jgi:hypothetical protein